MTKTEKFFLIMFISASMKFYAGDDRWLVFLLPVAFGVLFVLASNKAHQADETSPASSEK